MIKNFNQFINENNDTIWSGEYVSNHVINITPDEDNIPTEFLKIIQKHDFKIGSINIESLLSSDPDFKEYYDAYHPSDRRYSEHDLYDGIIDEDDIYEPIVVVNGQILDGYNRATELHKNGVETIEAYININ